MKIIWIACFALCTLILVSCGTNTKIDSEDEVSIAFGTDATFDIATWNLKEFPYQGITTIDQLARLIPMLKLEVIAFQEIHSVADFMQLAEMLPNYSAYVSDATASYRLAYLYDHRTVNVNDAYAIYTGMSTPFPRPPYVMDLSWNGNRMYIINNHLKAYGDNVIDFQDPNDEEMRRLRACQLLDEYVEQNLSNERVIVLGDMNDEIQEPPAYNVFTPFLDKPEEYLFTTMGIAQNITYQNSSYPSYPSMIDHILISDELFTAFSGAASYSKPILIENAMGSWSSYSALVSDHRPVGARFIFTSQ